MIKNYFKTAFRNLWKNKGYSLLNIGGLAIGIACAGLIFLWVEDELTYNHYFSNRELHLLLMLRPALWQQASRQKYQALKILQELPGVIANFFP
jgi:hypothetical protein